MTCEPPVHSPPHPIPTSPNSPQVRHGPSFLHYNFVCALLNDLFGIQTRGGCQCAGPYGLVRACRRACVDWW